MTRSALVDRYRLGSSVGPWKALAGGSEARPRIGLLLRVCAMAMCEGIACANARARWPARWSEDMRWPAQGASLKVCMRRRDDRVGRTDSERRGTGQVGNSEQTRQIRESVQGLGIQPDVALAS